MTLQNKRFVRPDEVETLVFDWGTIRFLSEPGVTDARLFSFGIVEMAPGKGHALHNHPGVEEIIYFLSGSGEQTVAGVRQAVKTGDLVHIAPGVEHETLNTSCEMMKVAVVYAPMGPEMLFRKLPGCERVAPRKRG